MTDAGPVPATDDPALRAVSEGVGGPPGEHARPHPWWTPVRVLLVVTAVCFSLGMLQKAPCFHDTWSDSQARYAEMCYSDLPYLYTGRGFAELAWPYDDDPGVRARYDVMEYPVGISYVAWGTAWVTHALSGFPDLQVRARQDPGAMYGQPDVQVEVRKYVAVSAVVFALCALVSTWLLSQVNPRRPWDALGFAAAPALALTGLVNWDLLAVVTVAAGLWAWRRGSPVLTGLFLGIGTAVKLYPLFLLGGVLVIAVKERRPLAAVNACAAAALTWVALNLPALLTGPQQWKVFWSFNADRGPDLGSVWFAVDSLTDGTITSHSVNLGSWLFFGVWCLGVAALGLLAPRSPRLAQLGFLVVAGFLLVNKVYSPQYVLWLLPLAVLARPRWRDLLIWQAGEVVYFAAVWWYLGGFLDAGGGDQPTYWLAIALRVLAELYLVVVVARDVLVPDRDPVERAQPISTRSKAVVV